MVARYLIGDSLTVLKTLPDASVDLVLTSPPFLALRSYLPADHPDKHLEMGSEATPGEFIDALLNLIEECDRVLAPHGSIAVELGDTYSGSGGSGGDYTDTGLRSGQEKFDGSAIQHRRSAVRNRDCGDGWPLEKSLCLIPESFRWALVYGRNPFNGRTTPQWRARNVVRWVRPNPPVGALGGKFRPATSEMVIACKSKTRYFDLDAVRKPMADSTARRAVNVRRGKSGKTAESPTASHGRDFELATGANSTGAPPLDWWCIPPGGYTGSHYAVYPPELCILPIEAMCPRKVCTVCGEPSRRVMASERVRLADGEMNPERVPPTRTDANGSTGIGKRHGMGVINITGRLD